MNLTITECSFESYSFFSDYRWMVRIESPKFCKPEDGRMQQTNIINNYFTLGTGSGITFTGFTVGIMNWYTRKNYHLNILNNLFEEMSDSKRVAPDRRSGPQPVPDPDVQHAYRAKRQHLPQHVFQ